MPFISTKSNFKIPKEKQETVKAKLGQAISLIPGKSEAYLMLAFENADMYFKGQAFDKIIFAEVKIFGTADRNSLDKLTSELCNIYEQELGVPGSNVYVKYEEVENWGYNGFNF